jgi:hypothetical protein
MIPVAARFGNAAAQPVSRRSASTQAERRVARRRAQSPVDRRVGK